MQNFQVRMQNWEKYGSGRIPCNRHAGSVAASNRGNQLIIGTSDSKGLSSPGIVAFPKHLGSYSPSPRFELSEACFPDFQL